MKLLLTGATGVAGLEALRFALSDPAITHITVLSRRPLPPSIPTQAYADPASVNSSSNTTTTTSTRSHSRYPPYTPTSTEISTLGTHKLTVLLHSDFSAYPPEVIERVRDYDACVWALGGTSMGVGVGGYVRMTHDFPVEMVRALRGAGVGKDKGKGEGGGPFRFVYITGESTDRTEKSRFLFARVKGRAENSLLSIASSPSSPIRVHFLRPGYFFPSHPHDRTHLRPLSARIMDRVLTPVLSVVAPNSRIDVRTLGRVAVEVAKGMGGVGTVGEEEEEEREVWRNREMVEVGRRWEEEAKEKERREEL